MSDVPWTAWMKVRVWFARLTNWAFVIGKYAAIGFILFFVLGTMLGLVLEGMGYPELARPLLEVINAVNNEIRKVVAGWF